MRDDIRLVALTFPDLPQGERETPIDLKRLLYKGGPSLPPNQIQQAIEQGFLGKALPERVELVTRVHEFISGKLAGGGSPITAKKQVSEFNQFFIWAERTEVLLALTNLEASYLQWAEYLHHRFKVVKDLAERSAYSAALHLGAVVDAVLERERSIIRLTRLKRPSDRKSPQGLQAEKQSLHDTFNFGHLLQDICDGLPLSAIWQMRIQIHLRGGGVLVPWTGGSAPRIERVLAHWEVRSFEERAREFESDRSLNRRGRRSVVNLRILAELLMFIGQTGMNLAQASKLKLRHYNYSSDIDGYKVRDYKARRGGEILFEIFSEYRHHFERYLEWRRSLFPESDELFPIIREGSHETRAPLFNLIISACKQANVPWVPPSKLRGTRVNWMLRRSGDPDLTAEVAQHHKQTLLEVYERPSLQRAAGEVTRFWLANDPVLAQVDPARAAAPGQCDGKAVASPAKPATAPSPDCIRPSGCLWCEHHRDIDSLDYVWCLACFRHLKILEVSKHAFPSAADKQAHPAQHAIDRLSEKLTWFGDSNAKRSSWVDEALARVEEGHYHPEWAYLILAIEEAVQ